MISETTRKLDLYDFFSILLPGVICLIGFLPFFPDGWPITSPANAVILLIGGYVLGRALEPASVRFSPSGYFANHREAFHAELNAPRIHTPATIRQLYEDCSGLFDVVSGTWEGGSVSRVESEDIYGLIRAYVHMDGRGRSRTFQAIYSFYRSMWIVFLLWGLLYTEYAVVKLTVGIPFSNFFPQSLIGSMGGHAAYAAMIAAGAAFIGMSVFTRAQDRYQRYFIQYLVSDFIVLENADYPEGVVMAESTDPSPQGRNSDSDSANSG